MRTTTHHAARRDIQNLQKRCEKRPTSQTEAHSLTLRKIAEENQYQVTPVLRNNEKIPVSQLHAALVNPNTSSSPRMLVESVGSIDPR